MIKLADFGLSRRIAEVSNSPIEIFGMIPYIDPRHFENQINGDVNRYKANEKSDVYSVGVILWEISSGRKPFESYDKLHQKLELMMEILNGKREDPISNTPKDFIRIYKSILLLFFLYLANLDNGLLIKYYSLNFLV